MGGVSPHVSIHGRLGVRKLRFYIVTWRLKAGIAEPEEPFIARQLLGKQVPAATNKEATIEVLLCYNDGNGVFC
jgi:hypothetical protein